MGGLGSGPWEGKATSIVVERCLKLSVGALAREGILETDNARGSLTWRGPSKSSIGFKVSTSPDGLKNIHLQFVRHDQEHTEHETIWLQTSRPYFGGVRWWFTCPGCGKRVAYLYLPPGHRLFLCRRCRGLSYYSQRLGPYDRTLVNARRIRRSLGGTESLSEQFPFKPKGMHWSTYQKIRWRYVSLQKRLTEYMLSWS